MPSEWHLEQKIKSALSMDLARKSYKSRVFKANGSNAVVLSWLINSISKEIAASITFSESTQDVWNDLRERFDITDGTKVYSLHRFINTLTQGGTSVSSYFTRLKELWEEFSTIVPLLACKCPSSVEYAKHVQQQKLFQFLMGLNDSYQSIKSQILLMSPLPSVNQADPIISQEEAQRSISSFPLPTADYSASTTTRGHGRIGRGRGRNNSSEECSYCHRRGHTRDNCFHIIGFPSNPQVGRG
ncbi:uncharacterized protein LOC129304622 [Prosopis cineraria]|uniref:uncharacterized protein LOC129304622 n=1 Tax=Prosopis cineraria TaxID=364024 RepID=UPI00240EC6AD|nr:uncharacterized protein LOC129304622 [Prosopis cineraria]